MSSYNARQVLLGKMAKRSQSRVDTFRGLRIIVGGVDVVLVTRVGGKVFVGGVVVREERPQLRQACRLF